MSEQWKIIFEASTVQSNVVKFLKNSSLSTHFDHHFNVTHPKTQKIGASTFAWYDLTQMFINIKAWPFLCGFPFFPGCLCGCDVMACGYCCNYPEGAGTARQLTKSMYQAAELGQKLGTAPEQQEMK